MNKKGGVGKPVMDYPLDQQLHEQSLRLMKELPVKPNPVVLEGKHVRLEPLSIERDARALYELTNGSAIDLGERHIDIYDPDSIVWRYMPGGPFANLDKFKEFLQPQVIADNGLCLCVFDCVTQSPVGVCNYMNNFPSHLKVEIGGIFYSPAVHRTQTNVEATYLLLKHAFASGYRRLEWKCDALNERSRRAALRMGFKFEAIQEQHFIIKGRNRNTAWYRILDSEWNGAGGVEQLLERLVAGPTSRDRA